MEYLTHALPVLALVPEIKQHRLSLLTVRERCLLTFKALSLQSGELGDEVTYLLAVTIDEVVLSHKPPGWKIWQSDLLQNQFLEQHIGGERFYERLLYHQRLQHKNILKVFLACMQMGYQGQWALFDSAEREVIIADLKKQLPELTESDNALILKKPRPTFLFPLILCLLLSGVCFIVNEKSLAKFERQLNKVAVTHVQ